MIMICGLDFAINLECFPHAFNVAPSPQHGWVRKCSFSWTSRYCILFVHRRGIIIMWLIIRQTSNNSAHGLKSTIKHHLNSSTSEKIPLFVFHQSSTSSQTNGYVVPATSRVATLSSFAGNSAMSIDSVTFVCKMDDWAMDYLNRISSRCDLLIWICGTQIKSIFLITYSCYCNSSFRF